MASVQQAAVNALTRWLEAQFPEARVLGDWPDADSQLPERAITILMVGPPDDEGLSGIDVSMAVIDASTGLYTFRARVRKQRLQIDVWTRYSLERDKLVAKLDVELNRGDFYTLGLSNGDRVAEGLLLRLDPVDGHVGHADFYFDGANNIKDAGQVQTGEYRALIAGELNVELEIQAEAPRLLTVKLQEHLSEGDPATAGTDTYDLTADDFSHTQS